MNKIKKRPRREPRKGALTDAIRSTAPRGVLPSCLLGLAAAVLCAVLLLLISSAIVYSTADPDRYVIPAGLSVLYICCFAGGLAASRANRRLGWICGLLVGLALAVLSFLLALPLSPSLSADRSPIMEVGLRGLAILFSVLGGLAGAETARKKKRTRRRARR